MLKTHPKEIPEHPMDNELRYFTHKLFIHLFKFLIKRGNGLAFLGTYKQGERLFVLRLEEVKTDNQQPSFGELAKKHEQVGRIETKYSVV